MKAGAAYVPVDCFAPARRAQRILTDCRVRALIIASTCVGMIPDDDGESTLAAVIAIGETPSSVAGVEVVPFEVAVRSGLSAPASRRSAGDLAYILYTSGSTGLPKGVMLTHKNAVSFVEWASSVFEPTEADRFSSHAPFHFDLSVLDIYLAIKHGASVHLISEDLGKQPKELAAFIAHRGLTVWYSTPSILTLLVQFGRLEAHDVSRLRLVLFAGEVFPVKHLRQLQKIWPSPVYYNLYGPTETNVCTFARIPAQIPDDRDTPYAVGSPCYHCSATVRDESGAHVPHGHEGLLYISGPSVFAGYWNRPEETQRAFLTKGTNRWYNTGDVVRLDDSEGFVYVGRRDRMVKRRGYRIELGEIERALYLHPSVREAAVLSTTTADNGVEIVAVLACNGGLRPSIVDLKLLCAGKLPAYMSPDRFVFRDELPTTSTAKVDYQRLKALLGDARVG